ncbi:hypothetical protein QE366_001832 [Nocardioides zeae]|nr:hypothetical protein [Nocardioides zeae]
MKIESGRLGATWTTVMSRWGAAGGPHDAAVGHGEQVAQHPDDGGDAGAGGHEEQLGGGGAVGDLGGQHELAGRLLEVDEGADLHAVHEVVGDDAVGHGLHRDRDVAVGARAVGERVGAPLADAVDVDADPHVLARHVPGPVAAGADDDGGGVGRLGRDGDDPAPQLGARTERVEEVQVVGRHERGDRRVRDPLEARTERRGACAPTGRRRQQGHRGAHASIVGARALDVVTLRR